MSARVLIVDDAAFLREALIQICEQAGLIVVGEASQGPEVLTAVEKTKPNLIIMDLVLPGANGIECAKQVLEKFPKVQIIACSSLSDELIREKAKAVGCVDFIAKPFLKSEIIQKLNQVIKKNFQREESHG